MENWSPKIARQSFLKDFLASIVVFLIALPLCMGIAIASGAPVEAGLITGIIGGLVVSVFSGSSFQVSGPAAGLSVLVLEYIQVHGFRTLGVILIIAGIMQVAAGFCRLGQLFRAVSPAVVNGMLSGIGLLIIASQFYVMLDLVPGKSPIQNILGIPAQVGNLALAMMGPSSYQTLSTQSYASLEAAMLGVVTILLMVLWKKIAPTKLQVVPGAVIAIGTVTALAAALNADVLRVALPSNILTALHLPDFAGAGKMATLDVLQNAFVLALIASAETLLSANAVDRLHTGPRCRYDKELIAQGIGNTLCGLAGGLPLTGVIARSSVNVHAGARSRLSAFMHGMWILFFVALLPNILRLIPTSCLAALLIFTGFKLIDLKSTRKLWSYGKRLVVIYVATVICIIATDLLTGVMIGVSLSILKLLYTMSRLEVALIQDRNQKAKVTLALSGAATFFSLPKLANALEDLPKNCELHVCLENLDYLDHACLDLIMAWKDQHESSGGVLVMDWGELQAAFRDKGRRLRHKNSRHNLGSDSRPQKVEV